jgi:hypothetical protein
MSGAAGQPDVSDIAHMLKENCEAVFRAIFPNAVQAGQYLQVDDLHGTTGDNLKLTTRGTKRGTWADYGTSSGDPRGMGDMLKLVELTLGEGKTSGVSGTALRWARGFLGLDTMDPKYFERWREKAKKAQRRNEARGAQDAERKRRSAEGLWLAGAPLTPSAAPVSYLQGRGIDFLAMGRKLPGALRFNARVPHGEVSEQRGEKALLPAMVSKVQSLSGQHAGTHITFLHFDRERGWIKLPPLSIDRTDPETGEVTQKKLTAAKKIWSPLFIGGHIPLWKGEHQCKLSDIPAGTPVYVSEGIEDGLSFAMANPLARVVAAATGGNVAKLQLPEQAGDLVLLAQNDLDPALKDKLESCIAAQQAQAREQGSSRKVRVKFPPPQFKDWNDWLRDDPREEVA